MLNWNYEKYEIILQLNTKCFFSESYTPPISWILPKNYEFCEYYRRNPDENLKKRVLSTEDHIFLNLSTATPNFVNPVYWPSLLAYLRQCLVFPCFKRNEVSNSETAAQIDRILCFLTLVSLALCWSVSHERYATLTILAVVWTLCSSLPQQLPNSFVNQVSSIKKP